jgi:hypothetical protein
MVRWVNVSRALVNKGFRLRKLDYGDMLFYRQERMWI